MNDKQRRDVEAILHYWARRADYFTDKCEEYEHIGAHDRAHRADERASEAITAMNAIWEVMNVIGYSVRWIDREKNTVIIKKREEHYEA